jgi:phospholipid/cholesterol/gamma-HCH transport system substrate-binding protein
MPSPRQVQWAKFRTTTVVALATIILSTLVFLLTGGSIMAPKTQIYLYLPDAAGLAPGSPVRVDGISVGKVSAVELTGNSEPNRIVKVTMTVERDRLPNLTEDSTAEPASDNIVGDKFIDVSSGSSPRHLQAGAELRFNPTPDLMQRLDIAQFRKQMHDVELLLDDIEQGRGPLGEFIAGDEFYTGIKQKVTKLERDIRLAAQTTTAVGQALYTDEMYRKVSEPLKELDESLAKLQAGEGLAGSLLKDTKSYDQAMAQASDLRRSLGKLGGQEMLQSSKAYDEWVRRAQMAIAQVDAFERSGMMTNSSFYDNLVGMSKELRESTQDFRKNPKKYLRMKLF